MLPAHLIPVKLGQLQPKDTIHVGSEVVWIDENDEYTQTRYEK